MATLLELYTALGLVRIADPVIEDIYREEEERIWREDLDSSPHGHPWHTSFHASQFPGDDPRACARMAMYRMMNIPEVEPVTRWLRCLGDAGKDHEVQLVRRFEDAGRLLSAGPDEPLQTVFQDTEHWLTASTDAIILPPFWRRPFPIEIKSKAQAKIDEMQLGQRLYDPQHRNQVLTTIGLARAANPWPVVKLCQHTWRLPIKQSGIVACREHGGWSCLIDVELEPVSDGSIFYFSRDTPSNTHEFYFTHDDDFIKAGIEKLAEWKEHFLQDHLPERPADWTWTEKPCQYCVDPCTLVLTADLRWVLASSLSEGDEIVGFDEEPSDQTRTRFRRASITSVDEISRPRVRVKTTLGSTTCSVEHRFLVKNSSGRRVWREAQDLKVGDHVVAALGAPWMEEDSHSAGYLAGIFDGEGSLAKNHVSVAQVEGPVLNKIKWLLSDRRFDFSQDVVDKRSDNPCYRIRINGGLAEQMRLLGSIRPERLLANAPRLWEGSATWCQTSRTAVVEAVEHLDDGAVLAIATTTSTLITDGLFSHNCNYKKFACKPDHKAKTTKLSESKAIEFAQQVRPGYLFDEAYETVIDRWREQEEQRAAA